MLFINIPQNFVEGKTSKKKNNNNQTSTLSQKTSLKKPLRTIKSMKYLNTSRTDQKHSEGRRLKRNVRATFVKHPIFLKSYEYVSLVTAVPNVSHNVSLKFNTFINIRTRVSIICSVKYR